MPMATSEHLDETSIRMSFLSLQYLNFVNNAYTTSDEIE